MASSFNEQNLSKVCSIMFQHASEGLVVVDRSGIIHLQNPRLAALFGYDDGELLGKPVEVLIPNALHGAHTAHRERYMKDPVQRPMGKGLDLNGQRKDGSVFPVEISLTHFVVDETRYAMGLVSDISERRAAELALSNNLTQLEQRVEERTEELRKAERNVREALEKERELNAMKSRFVSMASHEFRTPLSTIMSSVDLIGRYVEGPESEKVGKHVTKIRNKVRDLTGILNEFLSLDRLEQGNVTCAPSVFDLPELCIGLIEELRSMAKPGQRIDYDHTGEHREVRSDHQMLGHVLQNLINNAIKYSPEDRTILIHTRTDGDRVYIEVKDEGMGIPAADQPHMFERFFRASNAVHEQGTGLGLNIVRRYLDLLGGTVRFESEQGVGTTFFVELPPLIS